MYNQLDVPPMEGYHLTYPSYRVSYRQVVVVIIFIFLQKSYLFFLQIHKGPKQYVQLDFMIDFVQILFIQYA